MGAGLKRAWTAAEAEDGNPGADGEAVGHEDATSAAAGSGASTIMAPTKACRAPSVHRGSLRDDAPAHRRGATDVADPPRAAEQQSDPAESAPFSTLLAKTGHGSAPRPSAFQLGCGRHGVQIMRRACRTSTATGMDPGQW